MKARDFDIIVIGGGHAGVEAALAASRMGATSAVISMDRNKLALMSCNPAIGGIGKSQLVKEVDALGGLMGVAADATGIQFRRLNLSRGPAVWSTRVQSDRIAYNRYVVDFIEADPRVEVIEGLAGALIVERGRTVGVALETGEQIGCGAVVVATGTFLGGLIHIGDKKIKAGRMGDKAAYDLSDSFRSLGFEVARLKTGTPPRLDGATIDWSKCEIQPGEEPPPMLSWKSQREPFRQTPCYLTRTSRDTKQLISENFQLSPIFSGQINSRGPRYCPSIEDKFFRFSDKETHNIFLEPEGNGTNEIYPNGFSTALPEEVQREAIRTIIGLEQVEMTRPGYAVEYDYCPAHQIDRTLESRRVKGLFLAGQINGTSGYEEAAAQGLVAGTNAVCSLRGDEPFVPDRSEAYIGVMIDDLTTRSTTEPYRMFTSRAEYRLALREDNARDRLNDYARQFGLISQEDFESFNRLAGATEVEVKKLKSTRVKVEELGELAGRFVRREVISLAELIKIPGVTMSDISGVINKFDGMFSSDPEVRARAAIKLRYKGYIDKQEREIERFRRQESELIPDGFSYETLPGLKTEAREKLARFRPGSLGQAGRIEGVTPGDLAVLSIGLKRFRDERQA